LEDLKREIEEYPKINQLIKEGKLTKLQVEHQDQVKNAVISPCGKFLATSSKDNTAKVTEIATGNTVCTIEHQS